MIIMWHDRGANCCYNGNHIAKCKLYVLWLNLLSQSYFNNEKTIQQYQSGEKPQNQMK